MRVKISYKKIPGILIVVGLLVIINGCDDSSSSGSSGQVSSLDVMVFDNSNGAPVKDAHVAATFDYVIDDDKGNCSKTSENGHSLCTSVLIPLVSVPCAISVEFEIIHSNFQTFSDTVALTNCKGATTARLSK